MAKLPNDRKPKPIWVGVLQRTVRAPSAKLGAVILVVIVLACVFAPFIAPYGVNKMKISERFSVPSALHFFGTDSVGRDLFTRILYGGRYSLILGFFGSIFSTVVAIFMGCIAGYYGGFTESAIMRFLDIISSLPAILLCILISSVLGPGFVNTIIALAVSQVPSNVRMMRSQVLIERSQEYLEAAATINCSKATIIFKHMLPNAISPMIICLTMGIGDNIAMAASLSYIGLGVQPPTPEWGALLSDARTHLLTYPYLIIIPGICIALTVFATNLLGDGLRDAMDPRLRI
jgi:ABC-type dipeptide/oligopeptide/nickel transport system permease subunit